MKFRTLLPVLLTLLFMTLPSEPLPAAELTGSWVLTTEQAITEIEIIQWGAVFLVARSDTNTITAIGVTDADRLTVVDEFLQLYVGISDTEGVASGLEGTVLSWRARTFGRWAAIRAVDLDNFPFPIPTELIPTVPSREPAGEDPAAPTPDGSPTNEDNASTTREGVTATDDAAQGG